ncbi:MAG: helix-turn-helix transcriptional regulator [Mariprofundales bacterium]
MNMIRLARGNLGMTQAQFGAWLGKRMSRVKPFSRQEICQYERGRKPKEEVLSLCRLLAATYAIGANDIDKELLELIINSQKI